MKYTLGHFLLSLAERERTGEMCAAHYMSQSAFNITTFTPLRSIVRTADYRLCHCKNVEFRAGCFLRSIDISR